MSALHVRQVCPECKGTRVFALYRTQRRAAIYQCTKCGTIPGQHPPAFYDDAADNINRRPSRKVRKNPVSSRSAEATRAAKFAERFHGEPPEFEFVAQKPRIPSALAGIGKVHAIEYIAKRDGKVYTFRHVFKAASRPFLAVNPDGSNAQMIGGSFEFTDRGFEDR